MAKRPIFVSICQKPFVKTVEAEFQWHGGFAVSQQQKNILALHTAFKAVCPEKKVLEISSRSMQPLGVALSAFNLKKWVPQLSKSVPVECVYQGGKVFEQGGPYTELYGVSPKDAKRDGRFKTSGRLCGFFFDGKSFPITPVTAFYDWIYINAISENEGLASELLKYDAFTDIVFNPQKGINCQAIAAAIFCGLARKGLLDAAKDLDEFIKIY